MSAPVGAGRLRTVRSTVALGVTALVLVLGCGWMLLLGPATGALGTARQELTDARDANLLLTSRLARLQAQQEDLATVREVADDLTALFPPTADQPGFFRMVDRAVRAAGLAPRQVTTLSPTVPVVDGADPAGDSPASPAADPDTTSDADATPGDLAVQSVVVTVEGSYEQGQQLLAQLERLDRSFLVQSVTISGAETQTISITGSTFVAPLVPDPPDDLTDRRR